MTEPLSGQVTQMLGEWVNGDQKALDNLISVLYPELRRIARRHLRSERREHTLQSTALVNEALVRLLGAQPVNLRNRGHFISLASRMMRQILVDYARARQSEKRDGGLRLEIEALANLPVKGDAQLIALDDSLQELSQRDERQGKIVDMKFFGGLTTSEIAEVLCVSVATVERDWAVARVWLRRQIAEAEPK
jgi:RNA polymerase sigma factor (TIGR02999 family)